MLQMPYKQITEDFKLINVAVSMAKGFLVVFANIQYLENKLEPQSLIRELMYEMQSKELNDVKNIIDLVPDSKPVFDILLRRRN